MFTEECSSRRSHIYECKSRLGRIECHIWSNFLGDAGIKTAGFRACCGGGGAYNFNLLVPCGPKGNVCSDPEHTLFWDEVHFTEAFYRVMATFALSGRFVDGPSEAVNLKAACNLDFSSFAQTIPNPPSACEHHKHWSIQSPIWNFVGINGFRCLHGGCDHFVSCHLLQPQQMSIKISLHTLYVSFAGCISSDEAAWPLTFCWLKL